MIVFASGLFLRICLNSVVAVEVLALSETPWRVDQTGQFLASRGRAERRKEEGGAGSDVFSLDTAAAAGGAFATGMCFTGKGGVFAGSFVRTVPAATPDAIGVGGATARFKEGRSFFDGS